MGRRKLNELRLIYLIRKWHVTNNNNNNNDTLKELVVSFKGRDGPKRWMKGNF